MNNTLYDSMMQANLVVDHHESDLYTEDTAQARAIAKRFDYDDVDFRPFIDQRTGKQCLEFAFMYHPYWDAKKMEVRT